jgi:hypothetical protein
VGQGIPAPIVTAPVGQQEVRALRTQQAQLSQQLRAADARRTVLAQQLQGATGANRVGLEQQITALDQQILGIQTGLAATNLQLAQTPVAPRAGTLVPPPAGNNGISDNGAALMGVFMVFVLAPIAIAYARRVWKRSSAPALPHGWPDALQRLERMEQAVDTVAIEVERISENQRFLTRVLTERPDAGSARQSSADSAPRALGPGEAPFEPVRVQAREAVPVARPIDQRP